MTKRFLRRPDVEAKTGLPTSTIYERMAKGTFPRQRHLGPKTVVWLEDEIDAWMAAQIRKGDDKGGTGAKEAA